MLVFDRAELQAGDEITALIYLDGREDTKAGWIVKAPWGPHPAGASCIQMERLEGRILRDFALWEADIGGVDAFRVSRGSASTT